MWCYACNSLDKREPSKKPHFIRYVAQQRPKINELATKRTAYKYGILLILNPPQNKKENYSDFLLLLLLFVCYCVLHPKP